MTIRSSIQQLLSILSLLVAFVGPLAAQSNDQPLVIGTTVTLPSAVLNEKRTINIYLPEGYDPKDTVRYPVIYIPDGGVEEDFIHITGIVRYNTQPWVARFPKSIVVGITNTNRKRDFTFAVPQPVSLLRHHQPKPLVG